MKAQAWPGQDVHEGPGCAWPAGDVKQVPWLPTNTGISENSSFQSLTQKERWAAVGGGEGGVDAGIIVSDCIVESSPRSKMCVDQHGQVPRPLPTISHLIHLT